MHRGEAMHRRSIYQMAEEMDLPAQAMGDWHLEITGGRQILLSGHKGIRSYSDTEICVEFRDCALRLQGRELGILSMTKTELLLRGTLDTVSLIR